ncbi:MAG: glucose-1-phosphate cytidylyltransferase [Thermodesulfovibrio sp.]|nr:glucose-1-phosphate cytidylyltransferase [Thermodesulfovibrio sp.]
MKAVILAGGLGTRLSEETVVKPKPMVEIGGKPILWHILKIYSTFGVNDFIICLGYKGYMIKEYFANYFLHMSDVTFYMAENRMEVHDCKAESWKVTLVDTGELTNTGGRLKRVSKYLESDDIFCFTYGDGVANINIAEEIEFHKMHGKLATVAAVAPPGRFGTLILSENCQRSFSDKKIFCQATQVLSFTEKPKGDGGRINGGFFVLSPKVIELVKDDKTSFESEVLPKLAEMGELMAYIHDGFWHPMDTLRDKLYLEELWKSGKAPWKIW